MAITRRVFLAALTIGAAARRPVWANEPIRFHAYPFTLGVASGEPSADGFVIWTRLAPDPLHGGGMPPVSVPVHWTVACDEQMHEIAASGVTTTGPDRAHTVHVEVEGLNPDRPYWYRFEAADAVSPIGRSWTLPAAGTSPSRLRFAFASCQHYELGYYSAYRHLSQEDLRLVFHLGDYVYEGAARDGRPRRHKGHDLLTLHDYRTRYAQYKMDPDLQAAHAVCPWIVTWDDHEVADNYAGAFSEEHDPPEQFLVRRAAAYQAYFEHLPLRARSLPHGPDARMFRSFGYGRLASFFVLDTRQYRTDQPCGDGTTEPCDAMNDPRATMLGAEQERWLFDRFTRSTTPWNVIPQQVMVAKVNRRLHGVDRYSMDHWAGYEVARQRLLNCLSSRPEANPVVLTGDVHSNWVQDLRVRPDGPTIATELVGTSITSGGDGQDFPAHMQRVLADNPFVRFYNEQRGYVSCEITEAALSATYRVVDFVSTPGAPCHSCGRFVVERGRPGAQRL